MEKADHWSRTALILAGVFLFMLLLNIFMPIHRDDYDYSMVWGTAEHISSFGDVLQSLENHYMTHGGRMVTVFFLDFFLWMGKLPFDIANAAVFTGVLILLYFHATRDTKLTAEPGILALAALLMWLCLPHFGEVAVWKSGSTVYLWSGFFVLLFLLPYNLYMAGRLHWGGAMALPMFLAGILGGWSVENFAVTAVMLSAGTAWYAGKQGRASLWMAAGAAGAFLGLLGLVAAPGNWVRYGEQDSGKGLLIHIGNQFAGNGEMLLYLLPLVCLLLLVWRILKRYLLAEQGAILPEGKRGVMLGEGTALAVIVILLISYASGGFIGNAIRDALISGVLTPLGQDSPKAVYRLSRITAGFEEMVIYLAAVVLVYKMAGRALGFGRASEAQMVRKIRAQDVWTAWPEVRYAGFLILLCFVNNGFMLAAPTFPARATFGSSLMVIAAALAVLRIPLVQEALGGRAGRILRIGGCAAGLFLAAAALLISAHVTEENDARVAQIAGQAGRGAVVTFPPMETTQRALRHVFFVDFNNGVTKGGLCRYYGIQDIIIRSSIDNTK